MSVFNGLFFDLAAAVPGAADTFETKPAAVENDVKHRWLSREE
ncbi:hypothetical protein [Meridianimarinicoccus sp. MJW13]|nr:hypothetical protein [Fluviibacterium sp. MJW13]